MPGTDNDLFGHVAHTATASFQQERLWLRESRFTAAGAVSPHVLRVFPSGVDIPVLETALTCVVARHETLRTGFTDRSGEVLQVIWEPEEIRLSIENVSDASEEKAREKLVSLIRDEVRKVFDLTTGPIIRTRLFAIGDERIFLAVIHHIAFDRWSHGLFLSELAELYRAGVENETANLPRLAIQYRDYADWQHRKWLSGGFREDGEYWRKQMACRPALLELPSDRPRGESGPSSAGSSPIEISQALVHAVVAAAKTLRASLSVILLAAFQAALARWTGQDHVLVGTPVANRPLAEAEPLIGLFVNMVPLQARMVEGESFRNYVRRIRSDVFDAYDHQDLFFNHILDSVPEAERGDLVRVVFAYDDATTNLWQAAPFGEPMSSGVEGPVHYDLSVVIQRTAHGISGSANYPIARFDESTVQGFIADFVALLRRVTQDLDEPVFGLTAA
jgi:hypothetical protein